MTHVRHGLRPKIAIAAVAATIVALLVAGCGGGTSSSSAESASARSPMVAQADAICKVVNARRKAADEQVGAVTSDAALAKVAQIAPYLAAIERNAIIKLRKLTPPADVAPAWQKVLAGAELLSVNAGKLNEDAKAKNLKGAEAVIKADQKSEKELFAVAKKAGFRHCGRNA
jgi:hypothetical protein